MRRSVSRLIFLFFFFSFRFFVFRSANHPQDFNTRYWSGRYLLRARHVVASLAGRQDKILTTGKYLNVVRYHTLL